MNTLVSTINVKNAFDNQKVMVYTDSINESDYSFAKAEAVANALSELFPNCFVTVSVSNGSFVANSPLNMKKDEEEMEFDAFFAKWYPVKK